MVRFLLSLILLFPQIVKSQTNTISPQYDVGVFASENFVLNWGGDLNDLNVTDASSIHSVSTSSPLHGQRSHLIDGSATSQYVKFKTKVFPSLLAAGNCEATLFYSLDANSSYYKSYVENSSASKISQDYTWENGSSGSKKVQMFFPCPSSDYVNVVVEPTNASAPSVKVDKIYAGACIDCGSASVVTAWKDCASVAAGTLINGVTTDPSYGTVTVNKCQWRRVGVDAEIKWDFVQTSAGGDGSGIMLFTIPGEIGTIDTNKAGVYTGTDPKLAQSCTLGRIHARIANVNFDGCVHAYDSSNLGAFYSYDGSASGIAQWNNSSGWFGQAAAISITAKVPIAGWANVDAIRMDCAGTANCENTFSATISTTGTVSAENVDWIDGNCTNATPAVCTFVSGTFSATPNCTIGLVRGAASDGGTYSINAVSATSLSVTDTLSGVGNQQYVKTITCTRQSSDRKPQMNAPILVGGVTVPVSVQSWKVCPIKITNTGTPTEASDLAECVTSITDNAVGDFTLNFTSGKFTATPNCQCTAEGTGPGGGWHCNRHNGTAESSSVYRIATHQGGVGAVDIDVDLICMGY